MFRGLDHLRIPDHSILAVTNARGLYVCRVDPYMTLMACAHLGCLLNNCG